MRKIKFRAWDKEKKCMIVGHWSWYLSFDGRIWKADVSTEEKNLILMQYTGLKDKNGKECYEGDIVGWKNRKFEVRWGDYGAWMPLASDGFDITIWEIIGNVYSNPELI